MGLPLGFLKLRHSECLNPCPSHCSSHCYGCYALWMVAFIYPHNCTNPKEQPQYHTVRHSSYWYGCYVLWIRDRQLSLIVSTWLGLIPSVSLLPHHLQTGNPEGVFLTVTCTSILLYRCYHLFPDFFTQIHLWTCSELPQFLPIRPEGPFTVNSPSPTAPIWKEAIYTSFCAPHTRCRWCVVNPILY